MNHLSAKSLLAAVATAALLGTAAPAAVAGPPADKPSHSKTDRHAAKADRDAAKASKAEARVERVLARIAASRKLAKLDDASETRVEANIQADIDADGAEGLRPSRYRQVINQLAFAERLIVAAEIAGNTGATAAVHAVIDDLVMFTAATDKADLRDAKRSLQEWAHLLEDAPEEEEVEEEPEAETPETDTELEAGPAEGDTTA